MTLLKYPGSKIQCALWIRSNFPVGYKKMTYLEAFFGSGALFFEKPRSTIETINDINGNVVNFFRVVRDDPEQLAYLVNNTPWSREEYLLCMEDVENEIENARRFLVRQWFAIGGRGDRGSSGFRTNIKGNNGNIASFHQKLPLEILKVAERLKNQSNALVQIENKDAFELITRYEGSNTLMYLDPPYLMSTRKNKIYENEFTDDQHERLVELIKDSRSYIILSGYDNELYNSVLKGWQKETKEVYTEKGLKRTEVLWRNYTSCQYLLFEGGA